MASVAELLPRAARLKYELEVQLRAVEQGAGDAGDCGMGLRELFAQIGTLRQLLDAERPERRALWKVKIDELGHEAQFLLNDLRRVTRFHDHQRERDSLFRRRAGAAPSAAHDDLLEAEDSYARSGNQVDELMENGRASLDSLRAQRERLKNTHRNALDMINKLGLSDTVMKLINSRNRQDRKIVAGGFACLFALFYLCLRWRGQCVAYVPGEVSGTPGLKGLAAALNMPDGSAGVLDMRQHWSGLEALTGGLIEKANVYDIHHCPPDPTDKAAKFAAACKVAQIVGHSTACQRTCCAPGHSLMLHVNDRAGNTMVTIQRPGLGTGKYCLNHGACADCCRDEIIVHEGRVDAEATCCLCCHFNFCCFKQCDGCGQRVLNPNPVSKASVPFLGGGCKPRIDVFEDHDSARPNGRVDGPCCFGGCSELCCESKFVYKTLDGRDVGRVRKLVPSSCKDACLEIFTDSDKYSMEFYQGSTNEEKANTIGLALLLDYMFFERDNGMISCWQDDDRNDWAEDQGETGEVTAADFHIECTFCLMSLYGCICPCSCGITLSPSSDSDGGGGGGDFGSPAAPDGGEWEPKEEWLRNYMRNVKMHRG